MLSPVVETPGTPGGRGGRMCGASGRRISLFVSRGFGSACAQRGAHVRREGREETRSREARAPRIRLRDNATNPSGRRLKMGCSFLPPSLRLASSCGSRGPARGSSGPALSPRGGDEGLICSSLQSSVRAHIRCEQPGWLWALERSTGCLGRRRASRILRIDNLLCATVTPSRKVERVPRAPGCPASLSSGVQTPLTVPVPTPKVIGMGLESVIGIGWNR